MITIHGFVPNQIQDYAKVVFQAVCNPVSKFLVIFKSQIFQTLITIREGLKNKKN